MFSLGESKKQLRKTLKERLHEDAFKIAYDDDFLDAFDPNSKQAGQTLFIKGHRQTIIRLCKTPSRGVVAHEIFHAVEMIMRFLRMPLTPENDEAYAYMIGYITDKFYEQVK
jgi:hypothetical protein